MLVLGCTRGPHNCAAIIFTSLAANHSARVNLNTARAVVLLVRPLQSSHYELFCLFNLRKRNNLAGDLLPFMFRLVDLLELLDLLTYPSKLL